MWDKRFDTIVHNKDPYNAEPAPSALAGDDVTPLEVFYSRNHGPIPELDEDEWRLHIDGLVTTPLTLSLTDLSIQFPTHAVYATLQCAGNRRAGFNQVREIPGEDPWGPAATSTAQWRGARLADVLTTAGVTPNPTHHVAFSAPDISELATPSQPYGGSIPMTKALSEEVLLAWGMNCQPLPRIHGGPVRLIVPGYIGARSIKWITALTVQDHPSDNYFQASAYRILPADTDPDTTQPGDGISLSSIGLNCAVLSPDDGATKPAGPLTLRGYALAGDDRTIERVEVSLDRGHSWLPADLGPQLSTWTWRLWSLSCCVTPGPLHVTVRAWDSTGSTHPESAAALWNPKGYANNSWAHLDLTVI